MDLTVNVINTTTVVKTKQVQMKVSANFDGFEYIFELTAIVKDELKIGTDTVNICNIRPEDTYRRKIKLSPKTTGQSLNRALHAFNRLYQASSFGGLSNIESTKTLLLSALVKTHKLT